MRVDRIIARDLLGGQPGEPFRVILKANGGEGLVRLGIPAGDFAAAVRCFGETMGLDVAFDEGNTVEPSGRERDKIQLFVPEAPLSGHYRSRSQYLPVARSG
jgi:hypothetical protein